MYFNSPHHQPKLEVKNTCIPVTWVRRDVTAGEKKFDTLQMSFGCREVKGRAAVEVADVHVVAEKHVPARTNNNVLKNVRNGVNDCHTKYFQNVPKFI